ncbi:MAG: hypothetical protein GXP54_13380 [Deltaproteobacteria bacterium]|nr:hypothetical protein [Deltaproteobacteria bacterium]
MKRIVGIIAMMAVLSLLAACGSSDGGTDTINTPDTIINTDNGVDLGKYDPGLPPIDNGQLDKGLQTDKGQYDPGQPTDNGGVDQGQPTDNGGTDLNINPPQEGSCKWYFSCAGDCPPQPQGQACLQECQAGLSPQGQTDVEALFNCLDVNGCQAKPTNEEWAQCLNDFCLDPYFSCFSGNTYATCPDLVGCLNSCPDDNPGTPDVDEQSVCIGNCWSESTVDTQWSLQNLINCMYDNCTTCNDDYQGGTCQDCLNTVLGTGGQCEALNEACTSYGTWGCGHVFECVQGCTDQACAQDCFSNATKNAGTLYNDMIGCATDACPQCDTTPPGADCDTCFNAALNQDGACWDKTQACTADQDQ